MPSCHGVDSLISSHQSDTRAGSSIGVKLSGIFVIRTIFFFLFSRAFPGKPKSPQPHRKWIKQNKETNKKEQKEKKKKEKLRSRDTKEADWKREKKMRFFLIYILLFKYKYKYKSIYQSVQRGGYLINSFSHEVMKPFSLFSYWLSPKPSTTSST